MAGKARLRWGWWLGCLLVATTFGCGDGDDESASVPAQCEQLAAATCDRFYACNTADILVRAGLPVDEADCRTLFETRLGCANLTEESACAGTYHTDQARKCADQTEEQSCGEFANEMGPPACDQICS